MPETIETQSQIVTEQPKSVKIRTICVDTLTQIQDNQYMSDSRKAGHDKWRDYGQAIYTFGMDLQERGFELILVVGPPGSGKSNGIKTLQHDTNILYNCDNKNPTWAGGILEYGTKFVPKKLHKIPRDYSEIITHIDKGLSMGMFEDQRFAFLMGHTETYKSGNETLQRLKTLGNLTNKMQFEGKLETVFYSAVEKTETGRQWILTTQSDGFNTARSPETLFDDKIPNDYGMIVDKLLNRQ